MDQNIKIFTTQDGQAQLEVALEQETVWLSRAQMAMLFERDQSVERVIVATDCGGTAQLIGEAGYLVSPRNSSALAQGMCNALALSEVEASELGEKARQRIFEHFSLDVAVQKWLDIYGLSNAE